MHEKNRRKHPRIYRPVKVNYYYGRNLYTESTMSLSMGGLYVKTRHPLEVGSLFMVDFTLPGFDNHFKVMGKVIWKKVAGDANGPPGMGIKFSEVPKDDRIVLLQYLAGSQITQHEYET